MSTISRTDIHRPSAPEFDPARYTLRGCFDLQPEMNPAESAARIATVNAMIAQGYRFAGHSGRCGHCGHAIRYAALLTHDSGDMIYVGEDCLDNRFSLSQADFRRLRESAKLNRERVARSAAFDALCDRVPAYAWATYADNIATTARVDWEREVLSDLAAKARRYGDPSDKQIAFAESLVTKISDKHDEQIARDAAAAALVSSGVRVPTGRVEVVGEVVSTRFVDNDFGGTLKMLVLMDSGVKVWGSVPRAISPERGNRVRFTATVTPSDDDPVFGFYSRPTKAELL